ncbi:GNAT family N-acetyltransferase [Bacteroides sp. GD17]|uniref:GNAT family N-acetyltransferase n=1 Tax=Bacteroides sp. GD17 TaxID=3139826 RepID=UPI0025D51E1F|nr:GNAT family N-acetyltransferase [uncultured Bacteroides sp.]
MEHSINFWELLELGKIKVTLLNKDYTFKSFDCGNADLNDFLISDSKVYLKYLRYTTTLIETDSQIIAYYSLANDLLSISDRQDFADEMEDSKSKIDFEFWEKFLNQKMYPAAKIGRLAVDKNFQDQGIGTFLIRSLVQSFIKRNKTGCQFITVDAINDNSQRTIRFYEKNGFKLLTMNDVCKESRQMYKSLLEYIDLENV